MQATLDAGVPIAVIYCKYNDAILVGDKDSDRILQFDPETLRVTAHFADHKLRHPAGLACHDDGVLYAISQNKGKILEFDLDRPHARAYTVIDELPDAGEGLMLSSLC